ncbi:CDT1-like protein a, chloroplastic [Phoenix dactylifera]|uniref:CDT1-like protein a, chloroplastic n=1 Tax=Phoenix dactylifera TaxID=42345 RepID=A0A8B7MVH4_PHODC|nr:CDT1-like protein a, chloroplastic [Phoenix dactylifera]XP_017700149.2 CDT1-like protein a, chloroplastic [Phoenix dactylifera]
MEDNNCEKQTPIQFKCKKILPGVSSNESSSAAIQIVNADKNEDHVSIFASPTPEKPEWGSKSEVITSFARKKLVGSFQDEDVIGQSAVSHESTRLISDEDSLVSNFSEHSTHVLSTLLKDKSVELPDKYKALVDLFNRMESSIRLLHLRKKLPTFQNIRTQVEVLTKRKFFCRHLAQMKYVFPEAIQIEKILIHDEKSLCMNPDMKITLLLDVVECTHPEQSISKALCQAFHERLLDFFNTHPEGTEIPEAMLPEPFNPTTNPSLFLKRLSDESSSELPRTTLVDLEPLSSASHFPSSFQRQFSQKVIMPETQRSQLLSATESMESISSDDKARGNRGSPQKQERSSSVLTLKASAEGISTPNRYMVSHHSESTPAKANSSLDNVMTETPAQQTPKRPMPTPHDKMLIGIEKTASEFRFTSSARRSLIYSPSKTEGSMITPVVSMAEQNKTMQYSSHQAGKEISESLINPCVVHDVGPSTIEDHEVNQMGRRKRQEMLACLPDIFDTICIISRSTDCSLITKQELVHKILSNNLEIEETREVEEQLELLEELVPDWIRKKAVYSGDFLYCIKQTSDPKSVRARLVEAV